MRTKSLVLLLVISLGGCEYVHKVSPVGPSAIEDGITYGSTLAARTVTYPDTVLGMTRKQRFEVVIDTLWSDDDLEVDVSDAEDAFDIVHNCDVEQRYETPTPKRCVVTVTAFRCPLDAAPGSMVTRTIVVNRLEDDEVYNSNEIILTARAVAPSPFSVSNAALDFGGVENGDVKTLSVRISAELGDTAVVAELEQQGDRFTLYDDNCFEGMSRGQSCDLEIAYEAQGVGVVNEAILRLSYPQGLSNSPPPVAIVVRGSSLGGQEIDFEEIENRQIQSTPFALVATASSGLPVVFTSLTPPICTVSGVLVTMVAPGTCAIVANQPGNATYAAATGVTETFEIHKYPQTIDYEPVDDRQLSEETFLLEVTTDSGLPLTIRSATPQVCAVASLRVSLIAMGTCRIVVSNEGTALIEAGSVTIRFDVTDPREPPEAEPDPDEESDDTRVRSGRAGKAPASAKPARPAPLKKKGE